MQVVVLDEADKMLSLGFAPQLQRLHTLLQLGASSGKSKHGAAAFEKGAKHGGAAAGGGGSGGATQRPQVMLFTATMPEEVAAAAATWLRADARTVAIAHSAASISKTVVQVKSVFVNNINLLKSLRHHPATQ